METLNPSPVKLAILDTIGAKAGMDEYNHRLASALNRVGVTAVVYGTKEVSPFMEKYYGHQLIRGTWRSVQLRIQWNKLIPRLKKHSFSHVLIHVFRIDFWTNYMIQRVRRFGLMPVLIWHDIDPLLTTTTFSPRLHSVVSENNLILVHNRYSAEQWRFRFNMERPVHVIPHGHFVPLSLDAPTREEARQHLRIPSDLFCPLFFGMLKQSKGLDVLLEAMRPLHKSFHLLVAGRQRDLALNVRQELKDRSKRSRITLSMGYQSVKEMEYWFAAADAVVVPYRRIYQSGVAIQAISRGIPIVLSDIPPHQEWVSDGLPAFLFKDGNPDDLRNVLVDMEANPRESINRAERALAFIKNHHDWDRIAQQMKSLIIE